MTDSDPLVGKAIRAASYRDCQKYVPFTAIALGWQGVSLFESGQFPSPLVGALCIELTG
jgi:hypothetical protein